MKLKFRYIAAIVVVFLCNVSTFAQIEGDDLPAPAEGNGAQATPIDMFVIPLVALAIVFIVMYAVKVSKARSLK